MGFGVLVIDGMRWVPAQRRVVRAILATGVGSGLSVLGLAYAAALGFSIAQLADKAGSAAGALSENGKPAQGYSKVLYETEYLRELNSGSYFRRQRAKAAKGNSGSESTLERYSRSRLGRLPAGVQAAPATYGWRGDTYRTVCVRLCDGFYFPISTSTTRSRFSIDAAACRSKCGSAARLYVYKSNGGSPETMVDLRGRAYGELATAFVYRAKYDQSCKCRAHPWEAQSVKAHQLYASAEWQKRARRLARLDRRRWRRSVRRRAAQRKAMARYSRSVDNPFAVGGAGVTWTSGDAIPDPAVQRNEAEAQGAGRLRQTRAPANQRKYRRAMGLGVKPAVAGRSRSAPKRRRVRRRTWKSQVFGGSEN